ncbi:MAG: glycosyltransferase family 39 protein, partial [Chloroflexota bacterium]
MASAIIGGLALRSPGYMDADYYYATARQLVEGKGLWEPFLWNYLDDPAGLPHPSHLYWMPLASFLAAGSMAVFGRGFVQAQLPFLLLNTALPALAAYLALRLTGESRSAWHAGLLAIFPGFFLPFFWTTDTFALYAVLGGATLVVLEEAAEKRRAWVWLAAGILIGLAHLTRADGLLWVLPALMAVAWARDRRGLAGLALGYSAVMGPWMVRNLSVSGVPLGPGAGRTLWLLHYDELFSYPASLLTAERWWQSGLTAILSARLTALGVVLQSLLAVNALVFLAPSMAIGIWQLRNRTLVRLALTYLAVLVVSMSLVLPFVGMHGGYFHSSAGLMPVLWALAPTGLDKAVAWAARRRRWDRLSAIRVFTAASVALAALFTAGLTVRRLVGDWDASQQAYLEVGQALQALDAQPGNVAVNNPPGFFLATGLQAVVIPNGPPDVLREVLDRYAVEWVVLDHNRPEGLAELYEDPGRVAWLSVEGSLLFEGGARIWLLRYEDVNELRAGRLPSRPHPFPSAGGGWLHHLIDASPGEGRLIQEA